MNRRTTEDAENPIWTEADFKAARPAGEVLPETVAAQLVRSSEAPPKDSMAQAVRAAGPGLVRARIAPLRLDRAA